MPECQAAIEMPRYQCHKRVWALKIAALETNEDGSAKIAPSENGYAVFTAPKGWRERFKGTDDDLGYYVVYEDGFASWSPSLAFEHGYTKL